MLLILTMLLMVPLQDNPAFAGNVGNSLVIGIQSSKTLTIRPFEPMERDMLSVTNLVYESLITLDDDYMPQGCLAQSWEQNGNGSSWIFHLRTDVYFSDGTPLTAQDVATSAQYILDKANDENIADHGFYVNLKYYVSSVSARDEHTVVVRAKRKYFGLLYAMTFPVVPASQVTWDEPVGTGPYMIQTFNPKASMLLTANPHWWKAQPQVREIMVQFEDTARAVVDDYEYARVDTVFTRSIAGAQYRTGTSSLAMAYRTNQLECLYMNNSASELTVEVRKAIRYAIDKSKIINNAYMGMAAATDLPFYPGTWMYNDTLNGLFVRDMDEARRLLAEAGWEDSDENGILDRMTSSGNQRNLHLRFYYYEEPDNDVRMEAATQISETLAELGIECKVEPLTMANLKDKLSHGSYDLAIVPLAMDTCPDPGFMLMRGNTGNYCYYKSDRMTALFESLRTQVDQVGYRQKLMEIQSLFAEDCPFVCLYYRTGSVLSRYMYTTRRDVREYELLRGIEDFKP